MENTVENKVAETAADDALQESLPEEVDASEPIEAALQEAVEEQAAEPEVQTEEAPPRNEPGWIRKRVDKAVAKAVAEAEQRVAAEYEKRFAPMMQRMLDSEAQELVRQGEFKSLERAKEYLQLKQGVAPQPQQQPSRDEQGRFTSQQDVSVRADMLAKQAEKLKTKRGLDVMAEFNANDEVRQKVVSGEWDFYDVADSMDASQQHRRSAPAPMRSPNGASGSEKSSIATMTEDQFKRLEKRISEGKRYSV
jgi:DNA primase